MANKKIGLILSSFVLLLILSSFLISASLTINKQEVATMAITDLNKPAVFNLEITNDGAGDNFKIFNLVKLDMEPKDSFYIASGETKQITLKVYPTLSLGFWSFEYKIEGENSGITTDKLAIRIADIREVLDISFTSINPESKTAEVTIKNNGAHSFDKVSIELSSALFSKNLEFPMAGFDSKTVEIQLDSEKMRSLLAGPYMVTTRVTIEGKSATINPVITFNEQEGMKTTETFEGRIYQVHEIEKKNEGNTKTSASVLIEKNIFSSLFTSFNINPVKRQMNGFTVSYLFTKELPPGESLLVIAKTNWWILIIILVLLFIAYYLIDKYLTEKLVIKKRVQYVRTKGGEFALKVNVHVKARDYVEKIRLIDRLPPMVKLFERFGMTPPDKIDERTKRLEWNIAGLAKGEERVFSYIIYSKIGVVGRFELPQAAAIYEYIGKIKETNSNPAFFINNPQSRGEEQ